jgi:hypothetical protein
MTTVTKQAQITADQALIDGLNTRMPNLALTLVGQSFTTPQLVVLIKKRIDDNKASDVARATWLGTCDTAKVTMEQTAPVIDALHLFIESQVGQDTTALGAFGMKPRAKAVKSAATKAEAAAKAKATRALNHTMGSAQKKAADKAAAAPAEPPQATAPVTPPKA